jgi:hypothetical protein
MGSAGVDFREAPSCGVSRAVVVPVVVVGTTTVRPRSLDPSSGDRNSAHTRDPGAPAVDAWPQTDLPAAVAAYRGTVVGTPLPNRCPRARAGTEPFVTLRRLDGTRHNQDRRPTRIEGRPGSEAEQSNGLLVGKIGIN